MVSRGNIKNTRRGQDTTNRTQTSTICAHHYSGWGCTLRATDSHSGRLLHFSIWEQAAHGYRSPPFVNCHRAAHGCTVQMDGGSTLRVPFPYFDGRGEGHCGQSSNLQIGQLIFFFFFFWQWFLNSWNVFMIFFFFLKLSVLTQTSIRLVRTNGSGQSFFSLWIIMLHPPLDFGRHVFHLINRK